MQPVNPNPRASFDLIETRRGALPTRCVTRAASDPDFYFSKHRKTLRSGVSFEVVAVPEWSQYLNSVPIIELCEHITVLLLAGVKSSPISAFKNHAGSVPGLSTVPIIELC